MKEHVQAVLVVVCVIAISTLFYASPSGVFFYGDITIKMYSWSSALATVLGFITCVSPVLMSWTLVLTAVTTCFFKQTKTRNLNVRSYRDQYFAQNFATAIVISAMAYDLFYSRTLYSVDKTMIAKDVELSDAVTEQMSNFIVFNAVIMFVKVAVMLFYSALGSCGAQALPRALQNLNRATSSVWMLHVGLFSLYVLNTIIHN